MLESYQSDEGYDVFVYYAKEIKDVASVLDQFSKEYPNYTILSWQLSVKVRDDEVLDVLTIFAKQVQKAGE